MKISKITALTLAAGTIGFAVADDSAEIQSGMNAYCKAILSHNMTGANKLLDKFFAPNAVMTAKDGKTMSFSEWKSTIEASMASMKVDKIELKLLNFHSRGNTAMGSESFHLTARMQDPSNPKKMALLTIDDKSEDTFTKVNGKWLISKSKTVAETITMNGKPMKM